jgi:nicotinate-nucleotide adenylyltransferase
VNTKDSVILFGGSFDPIHNGHITMARFARETLAASRVIFIPASRSPLKPHPPVTCGEDRAAMIRIAIAGIAGFEVSDIELHRSEPSYTIDTINHFRSLYDESMQLYWLIGADALNDLPFWYRIEQVIERCQLCVMHRAGHKLPDLDSLRTLFSNEQIDGLARHIIKTPLVDISSTEVRRLLRQGEDIGEMLPQGVLEYIYQKRLYGVLNSESGA